MLRLLIALLIIAPFATWAHEPAPPGPVPVPSGHEQGSEQGDGSRRLMPGAGWSGDTLAFAGRALEASEEVSRSGPISTPPAASRSAEGHQHLVPAAGHEGHHAGPAHHEGPSESGCMQAGHCSSVQLLLPIQIDAPEAPVRNAWGTPGDHGAASLKPEASTPPPRSF